MNTDTEKPYTYQTTYWKRVRKTCDYKHIIEKCKSENELLGLCWSIGLDEGVALAIYNASDEIKAPF